MKVLINAGCSFNRGAPNFEQAGSATATREATLPYEPIRLEYLAFNVGDVRTDFRVQTVTWNDIEQRYEVRVYAEARPLAERDRLKNARNWKDVVIKE